MQKLDEQSQLNIRGGLSSACGIAVGIAAVLALSGPEGWLLLAEAAEAGGAQAAIAACAAG
jgi:hypothetical protein